MKTKKVVGGGVGAHLHLCRHRKHCSYSTRSRAENRRIWLYN